MAIVAGQIVHASDLNGLGGLASVLTTDTAPVNNSTALVSTALVIALAANTTYALDSLIVCDTSAAADLKWNLSLPSGASVSFANWGADTGTSTFNGPIAHDWVVGATGSVLGGIASGSPVSARTVGTITTGVTAGNLVYQFAQVTATAINTFLKAGSWIRLQKLL